MKIHYCKTQLKPIFSASRPLSLIIRAIIIITLLASPLSTSLNSYAQTSARVTGRPQSTSTNAVIPRASIQWSPKIRPGFFEQVNERYLILNGKSQINNPNFKFFSDQWYQKTHGTVLVVKFTGRNTNPSSVVIKLINVLNAKPGTRQTFKELSLGDTITTLPFAPGDNMQQRHFLISNDVASGYYILNLIVNFGGHLSIVYTGKMFVPAAKTPVGATGHSTTVIRATATARAIITGRPPTINCPSTQYFDDDIDRCVDKVYIPTNPCILSLGICYPTGPTYIICPGSTNFNPYTGFCEIPPPILASRAGPNCPDGSTPAADGTCPPPPTLQQQCIANPAIGTTCPTPSQTSPTTTCPDGSQPAADGSCPTPSQTSPTTTCPDGSPAAADGSCPPPPPPTQQPVDPCVQDPSAPGCSTTSSPYSWYGSSNERQEST